MRVTGFVNVKDYEQSEMLGRDVTVTVTLANGSIEKFSGKLGFASPIIQAGGEYRVWAEIQNRRRGQFWILRPGLSAEMTIQIADQTGSGS